MCNVSLELAFNMMDVGWIGNQKTR